MIIDTETFTEVAVHLKLASDSVLTVARGLAIVSGQQREQGNDVAWAAVLDGLMAVNHEIAVMERTLTAVMHANAEEQGKSLPQRH